MGGKKRVCICSVAFLKVQLIHLCLKDTRGVSFLRFLAKQSGVCLVGDLGQPIGAACVVDCHQLWELRNFGHGELSSPGSRRPQSQVQKHALESQLEKRCFSLRFFSVLHQN